MPGLQFVIDGPPPVTLEIPGLVLDPIDYSPWELPLQFTKVAGLIGETVLSQKSGKRAITFRMRIYDSYANLVALLAKLTEIDAATGSEGTIGVYDPTNVLQITLTKCVLQPIKLNFHRADYIHGYWADVAIPFAQLRQG